MADQPPDEVVGAVTDGLDVDWDAALRAAPPEQRPLLEQLRVLSSISRASGFPPNPESILVTRHWGPFDIDEELDRGSYGRVYRAHDTRVDRDVAVKLLPGGTTPEDSGLTEARALAKVRHANVVAVYGADQFDGIPGLWTEFVEGETLEQFLNTHGHLSAREAALIGIDLCGALAAVHGAGLVHRDVTARNVMRERGGRIVLLDFGGVSRTSPEPGAATGRLAGTPLYMAPELFEGQAASPQSDIYALGVLLFLMVTRRYPVTGDTPEALAAAHREPRRLFAVDVRADLSPALAQVIDRALQVDPQRRYVSAGEMRRALVRSLDVGSPQSSVVRPPAPRQGLPTWVMAVLLLAAAAAGAAATAAVLWNRASPGAESAASTPQLTPEQWSILDSYRDLADSSAAHADWGAAAATYGKAAEVFAARLGASSGPVAIERARSAFARQQAGADPADIDAEFAQSLYTVAERAGAKQPIRAAIEGARALNLWRAGRFEEASHAVALSIEIRERVFRSDAAAGTRLPQMGFALAGLTEQLRSVPPTLDTDGDWLPDAIEMAAGLNPRSRDTDANGVPDDEEDTDGDGVSNGLEWALTTDPSQVYGFEGTANPADIGARWHDEGVGRAGPSPERAWRIGGKGVPFYSIAVSDAKKLAAAHGWRLFLRARVLRGDAFVGFDLLPHGPAYALNPVKQDDNATTIRLLTRSSAADALVFNLPAAQRDSLFELTYDQGLDTVVFRVDGRRVATGYRGLRENQRSEGLVWGSANDMGTKTDGEADFRLVLLEIK